MDGKRAKVEEIVNRFRWIDENRIHIINEEGIERIVDTVNNFNEI